MFRLACILQIADVIRQVVFFAVLAMLLAVGRLFLLPKTCQMFSRLHLRSCPRAVTLRKFLKVDFHCRVILHAYASKIYARK